MRNINKHVEQSLSITKELKTLLNTDGLVKTIDQEHDNKSVHFLDRVGERETSVVFNDVADF